MCFYMAEVTRDCTVKPDPGDGAIAAEVYGYLQGGPVASGESVDGGSISGKEGLA